MILSDPSQIVGTGVAVSYRQDDGVHPLVPEMVVRVRLRSAVRSVWGLICGVVIAMIIGFAWGGWTTFGTSRTQTKEAVLASQAAICVAQFMKQPNHDEKLKALDAVNSWERAAVIEKGSWDKMPGLHSLRGSDAVDVDEPLRQQSGHLAQAVES